MDTVNLVKVYLDCIEHQILPLTAKGIESGSKVFGAAIFRKDDLKTVMVASNDEQACPMWHGEVNCIKKFYELPKSERPDPKDCLFLATHEPCSLCINAITWSGFDNFTYLFTYEDTRDAFSIPYDIDILEAVFKVPTEGESEEAFSKRPLYNRTNKFFKSTSMVQQLQTIDDVEQRRALIGQIERIKEVYDDFAKSYAQTRGSKDIPLA